ncbi:MAG: type II toxin-antitoxin system VapC family toxin [Betaproteobacteria bacterium]|nr:type II toxin-antitoxin system VapC family toxin [Betaproteobacteria bacterium]
MIYLLDSNVCIHLLNGRHTTLIQRFRQYDPRQTVLCSMVKAELMRGALRSQRVELNLERLAIFFAPLKSLPFDDSAADHFARVGAELMKRGTPIGPNDLVIAATALAHQVTLVTHNTAEFSRVPGLRLEDWEI